MNNVSVEYHGWKLLFATWDIRAIVMLSFSLQVFLFFAGPLRKRTASPWVVMPMWLAYILADVVASFALGLISRSQGDTSESVTSPDLLTLWACFLLLHLGGPDSITAFAIEDNELWLRHFLNLVFQCGLVFYCLVQSVTGNKLLLVSAILMYIMGSIRYMERVRSLSLASSPKARRIMCPTRTITKGYGDENLVEEQMTDLQLLKCAFRLFSAFKGLIADVSYTFEECSSSREFFLRRNQKDAFKLVELELSFFYGILYTKVWVVQSSFSYLIRYSHISLYTLVFIFLVVFEDTLEIKRIDTVITYILLLGNFLLDQISFIMLHNSDWATAVITTWSDCFREYLLDIGIIRLFRRFRENFLDIGIIRLFGNRLRSQERYVRWLFNWHHYGWSNCVYQYKWIDNSLYPPSERLEGLLSYLGLVIVINMLDSRRYVKDVAFDNGMRDLIFEQLKLRSELAANSYTANDISSRGHWIVLHEEWTNFRRWIDNFEFSHCLIIWHIATELIFNTDCGHMDSAMDDTESSMKNSRELSKRLSDYMLYVMIMQPAMMSTVAGAGEFRYRSTCDDAKKFLRGRNVVEEERTNWFRKLFHGRKTRKNRNETKRKLESVRACKSIMNDYTVPIQTDQAGKTSISVLFDARALALELNKLEDTRKWEIVSKVWVDILCYAASHCKVNAHAAQLCKGGQLLTHVWLLMFHFGLINNS